MGLAHADDLFVASATAGLGNAIADLSHEAGDDPLDNFFAGEGRGKSGGGAGAGDMGGGGGGGGGDGSSSFAPQSTGAEPNTPGPTGQVSDASSLDPFVNGSSAASPGLATNSDASSPMNVGAFQPVGGQPQDAASPAGTGASALPTLPTSPAAAEFNFTPQGAPSFVSAPSTPGSSSSPVDDSPVVTALGQLPLSFEVNQGQVDSQVQFLSRGHGYDLFLTGTSATLVLKPSAAGPASDETGPVATADAQVLRMNFVGARPDASAVGGDRQAGIVNYFIGNDPSQWHTNVPTYAKVDVSNVYPGIDLVYYGNQGQLEYDWVVAPGADASTIQLSFDGAQQLELDGQGNLIIHTAGGDVTQDAPVLYQDVGGVRHAVSGAFALKDNGQVGIAVGAYDHSLPLVIDPTLSYSTYLGGSGSDIAYGIAVDGSGNVYVSGTTASTNFPTQGAYQTDQANADLFVTKLNSTGTALLYSTYVGGSGQENATSGIAVDSSGNAYVGSWTSSSNFPTVNPYSSGSIYGGGVLFRLNSSGNSLSYSTYFDGAIEGIAIDGSGHAYVTGVIGPYGMPTLSAYQSTFGGGLNDAFVAKFDTTASGTASLSFSTYFGGSGSDVGHAIALDSSGNAYITGETTSTDLPTQSAFQSANGGQTDAFVAKLSSSGSSLIYSTYLGGSSTLGYPVDIGEAIAVDSSGYAYVAGMTLSSNFPTANAIQGSSWSGSKGFVTKLNTSGSGLEYSTYLGGTNDINEAHGIAVDSSGNAFVTGLSRATDFPTVAAVQSAGGGSFDAFLTKINPAGTAYVVSTFLGGSGDDRGHALAVDSSGAVYIAGETASTNFPTTSGVSQTSSAGSTDAFVTKISGLASSAYTVSTQANTTTTSSQSGQVHEVFTVSRSGGSTDTPVTVYYATTSTATAGTDYVGLTGSITIPAGQTTATITLTPILTTSLTTSKTVVITLTSNPGYLQSSPSATVTLVPPLPASQPPNPGTGGMPGTAPGLPGTGPTPAGVCPAPVNPSNGNVATSATDLVGASNGNPPALVRTWSNGAYAAGSSNGTGWMNALLPFLQQDGSNTIAAVTDGNGARYFDLSGGTYTERFAGQDQLTYDSGSGLFTLTDTVGNRIQFYDFNGSLPAGQRGAFQSLTDAGGNVTQVVSRNGSGKATEMRRSNTSGSVTVTESFTFSYQVGGSNDGLLTNVTLRRQTNGGSWSTVRQVAYAYYVDSDAYGSARDLKTATIKDAAGTVLDTMYYRYYEGEAGGYPHALKYVFNAASYARLVAAVGTPTSSTDVQVAPYADQYFEYDSQWRVTTLIAQGEGCSSCSAGQGTYTYSYSQSSNTAGFNSWSFKTIETLPDGNQNIYYANAYGQTMLLVYHDVVTSQNWEWFTKFDSDGRPVLMAAPSALTGYDDTYADLLHSVSGNYQYLADSAGLIQVIDYYTSTTATGSTAGGVAGYQQDTKIQQGETGTAILQDTEAYYTHTGGSATVNPLATVTVYRNTNGTGGQTTSFAYMWFASSTQPESLTVTYPTVSSGQNGPGSADQEVSYFDTYGRTVWHKDAEGYLTYIGYDLATGDVVRTVEDVQTAPVLTAVDIGSPSPAGSASVSSGTYTVVGGGADIYGWSDQFTFAAQTWSGDGVLIARITSLTNTNGSAKAAVMFRDSTAAGASYALVDVTPGAGVEFLRRQSNTGGGSSATTVTGITAPVWVKLTRVGNLFTAYYSSNGTSWTLIGSDTVIMGTDALAGLAACSHNNGTATTATFTNVSLTPSMGWTTPAGGGLNLTTTAAIDALGRPTQVTLPAGNIIYTTYNDASHEMRVYQGWNTSTNAPTGPTWVYREDRAGSYTEVLTTADTPHLTSSKPDGTETITIGNLQTLTRSHVSAGGQVDTVDAYASFSGVSAYGTALVLAGASAGTHYFRTAFGYDNRGRNNRVLTPNGTIYRTVSDGLGRPASTWVGTDDTPTTGFWSPTNLTGTDTVQVSAYVYDNGGVGDGNLTQTTAYPGGGAAAQVNQFYFDWRDRVVAEKDGVEVSESTATNRPITYLEYDNLDEVIATRQFDGDAVTITSTSGVPNQPSSSLLRAYATASYDEQGRIFSTDVYSVDPSSGSVSSDSLTTNFWFDHRGNVIKASAPGGIVSKVQYDGVNRVIKEFTTDGGGDSGWSDADDVTGDAVLEQVETTYDLNSNVIFVTARQRFHDETATGALGDAGTTPKARVTYAAAYYDLADRLTATVDVGTNGGSAYTRPGSVPSRSDTVLVSSVTYDASGWAQDVTDPRGLVDRTLYDRLGRTTTTIGNYVDGTPSAGDDRTLRYTYDGNDNVLTVTADLPSGTNDQTTQYVYGVTAGTGSDITSNDILAEVRYPDPTTGAASSSEKEVYTVNALGETKTATDRNGNVHTFSRDVLGRMTVDAVTTLGSGVNGTVRRREIAYDTQGNPYLFTSFDAASGGTIVNQVQRGFNGLGQMTTEWQAHAGAVNTSTTPKVQSAYSEMAGGANHSRLVSMTYPNGRVLNYNYGTGLDDAISRLTSISDTSATLESYAYLGVGTVVKRAHADTGIDQTFIKLSGESVGDAGDPYTGLDRFGRIADVRWQNSAGSTVTDRFQYGYDRDGNALYRDNVVNTAFGELYHVNGLGNGYDGFNQIVSFARGALNGGKDTISSPSHTQSYALDAIGNFDSVTTDTVTQTRDTNAQNELTSISGATSPTYDSNGNLTKDETGQLYVWNAWNELVQVKTSGGVSIVTYSFDALSRRITEDTGTVRHLYFDGANVVEERLGGSSNAAVQYVWCPLAVNTLVERDRDTDANGTLDERLYVQTDANNNVTALVNPSGTVVERYVYDPFGVVTIYDASYSTVRSSSSYGMNYLFQDGRFETETGNYVFHFRVYRPTIQVWVSADPSGFAGGSFVLYAFVKNSPGNYIDPRGLEGTKLGVQLNLLTFTKHEMGAINKWWSGLGETERKTINGQLAAVVKRAIGGNGTNGRADPRALAWSQWLVLMDNPGLKPLLDAAHQQEERDRQPLKPPGQCPPPPNKNFGHYFGLFLDYTVGSRQLFVDFFTVSNFAAHVIDSWRKTEDFQRYKAIPGLGASVSIFDSTMDLIWGTRPKEDGGRWGAARELGLTLLLMGMAYKFSPRQDALRRLENAEKDLRFYRGLLKDAEMDGNVTAAEGLREAIKLIHNDIREAKSILGK
ncbi:MAG: SBBP repeat-containing protein [Gemmataceae bacterium]|nr:SBBP repeat-containing protein [Gemmataceae bacterium]